MTVTAATAPGDDRRVLRYAQRTVRPYSAHYRAVLPEGSFRDLSGIPPTELADIEDPASLVLRPDLRTITRGRDRWFAARAVAAKASGGFHRFNARVVEDRFKPIHWVVDGGVPLGYSATDLQRLAGRGQAWLERAGVRTHDVVVSLLPPGPTVAYWQLVLGCRRARITSLHVDPALDPAWAERLAPSVLAGEPHQLTALLAAAHRSGRALPNLRTVLSVGEPLGPEVRAELRAYAPGAVLVAAWAPSGVRSLWSECRAAAERSAVTGYHAWNDDVLEVGPDNELWWTGVGWRGSAVLRLRTHQAVAIDRTPCPACGEGPARIFPAVADSSPEAALDADAEVAAWQTEYRTVGGARELIVTLAPTWGAAVVPLVRRLDQRVRATQFVVLGVDEVEHRRVRGSW